MRSYGQHCALAKALDVVGDRWTLLIVRELLLRGGARYTDLRNGLPGIASNLLAERLRQLEGAGVIRSSYAPPPVATTLFELTERGRALEAPLRELGRWGAPLLAEAPDEDAFRTHWLGLPARLYLEDRHPDGPPVTIELRTGDEPLLIDIAGTITARVPRDERADLVLTGPHRLVSAVLFEGLDLAAASQQGLSFEGDASVLRRLHGPSEPRRDQRARTGLRR